MKKNLICVSVIGLLFLSACGSGKKPVLSPQNRGSAKEMYEKARTSAKRNSEKARLLFKEVMQLYPDSIYARRAKIGVADTYFKQGDSAALVVAASEYQEYVSLYPNSPDAAYAKFQIGECYFEQMRKPERDQSNTFAAIKAYQELLEQYPGTREAADAEKRIARARKVLGTHYWRIGYYNFRYGSYNGAVQRFKQVMDEYPEFKHNGKLYFYTGRSYMKMRMYDSAISFFQKVISSFPKSKYAKKSAKLMQKADALNKLKGAAKKRS